VNRFSELAWIFYGLKISENSQMLEIVFNSTPSTVPRQIAKAAAQ
jgi:hypothetical protein